MKVAFIFPPAWAPWAPSYAMGLLRSQATKRGHTFIGFDLNIDLHNAVSKDEQKLWLDENVPFWYKEKFLASFIDRYSSFIDEYIDQIIGTGAPLCAFSVTGASAPFARLIAEKIKKKNGSMFILFGGPDCFRSEKGLGLLDDPAVDAICTGEADHVWPDFLDMFEQNGFRVGELRGICYKGEDGNIIDCGDPDLVKDLNILPYADYEPSDFSKYTIPNRACLMMSRGCVNRCAYCSESPNFLRFRYRSAENLFEEVKRVVGLIKKRSGAKPFINFSDSLINGKPDVLAAFCDKVIQAGIDFSWAGMAVIRKEMTRELLGKMKKAGCTEVMWGLESGSTRVLELMRKTLYTPELAEEIIHAAAEIGIVQCANFIVGFPGETEEMFLETVQFVIRNEKYFNNVGLPLMEIRRNSRVYDRFDEYGIESPDVSVEWKTVDGFNTYDLRIARRNLLSAILGDKFFDQGRYDEEKAKEDATLEAISPDAQTVGEHSLSETGKRASIKQLLLPELVYLSLRFPRVYDVIRAGYHKARSGKNPVNQVSNDNSVQNSSTPTEEMTDRETVSSKWGEFFEKRGSDSRSKRMFAADHPLVRKYIQDAYLDGQDPTRYVMKYLNKVPSEWALEIGCGPGILSIGMARGGLCKRLDAFDISEKAIEIAKRSAEEQGIRTISFEVRDANTISLPKNRYDLIVINQSLHHIENLENLYDQVSGALTDDGIFWASDYVGPARHQWTDKQLEIINAINALLPEKYRTFGFDETRVRTNVEKIPLEAFLKDDPSEAVRSNEILPLAKQRLDVVEIRPWGHSITYPLLLDTIHNYDENSETDNALLRLICLLESTLINEGVLESDFALFVARKRRC